MNSVSFIIPAFNCERTLEEAVLSIFEKENFADGDEVIIVDDASTDNTPRVIAGLRDKFPQIVALKHNINKGSAAAGRNTGIDASKNELIFCLDADNVLEENSIPQLVQFYISNNVAAAALGGIRYFKNEIGNIIKTIDFNPIVTVTDCLNQPNSTPCPSGNYLFSKSVWKEVGRYDENIGGAYDSWAFGFKLLIGGKKFTTLPNTWYYHRIGYESTYIREVSKSNTSLNLLRVLIPHLNQFDKKDVNYMLSKNGRETWWNNKDKRPIRLKK